MSAHRVVHHRDEGFRTAARISRPGCRVLLRADVGAGGVGHNSSVRMRAEALEHLLGKHDGIDVMHLIVVIFSAPQTVRMRVDLIGGIQLENLKELKGAGMNGIAVVSAVFSASDIKRATKDLKQKVREIVES